MIRTSLTRREIRSRCTLIVRWERWFNACVVTIVLSLLVIGAWSLLDGPPDRAWTVPIASLGTASWVVAYGALRRHLVPLMANERGWYFFDRDERDACWFVPWSMCAEPVERAVPSSTEPGLTSSEIDLEVSVGREDPVPGAKWIKTIRRDDSVLFVLDRFFAGSTARDLSALWRESRGVPDPARADDVVRRGD